MDVVAIIPARYESSRFPGKPLADICGKPMIWWVYQNCLAVPTFSDVIVATDDMRIYTCCQNLNMHVMMTSKQHRTGTDRICEVASRVPADLYVNIQGDEPLLEPETIAKVIPPFSEFKDLQVCNLMTRIQDPCDLINNTVPKVITNKDNDALFLTRAAAPYPKGALDVDYYKQVCVYGFTPNALNFFSAYAQTYGKAKIEAIEDIEILRFIESGIRVHYVDVETASVAVDTPKDLEKVRTLMKKREAAACRG